MSGEDVPGFWGVCWDCFVCLGVLMGCLFSCVVWISRWVRREGAGLCVCSGMGESCLFLGGLVMSVEMERCRFLGRLASSEEMGTSPRFYRQQHVGFRVEGSCGLRFVGVIRSIQHRFHPEKREFP